MLVCVLLCVDIYVRLLSDIASHAAPLVAFLKTGLINCPDHLTDIPLDTLKFFVKQQEKACAQALENRINDSEYVCVFFVYVSTYLVCACVCVRLCSPQGLFITISKH